MIPLCQSAEPVMDIVEFFLCYCYDKLRLRANFKAPLAEQRAASVGMALGTLALILP